MSGERLEVLFLPRIDQAFAADLVREVWAWDPCTLFGADQARQGVLEARRIQGTNGPDDEDCARQESCDGQSVGSYDDDDDGYDDDEGYRRPSLPRLFRAPVACRSPSSSLPPMPQWLRLHRLLLFLLTHSLKNVSPTFYI